MRRPTQSDKLRQTSFNAPNELFRDYPKSTTFAIKPSEHQKSNYTRFRQHHLNI